MRPQTLHALELGGAILGQTFLLAGGWGFLGAVSLHGSLIVSDSLAVLMSSKQTETTWIVTLLATILSVSNTTFLSIAFKEALRHRMHSSISLIQLNSGIALARVSFLVNFRHLIATSITMVVFGLTRLLVSSWATLLTPTLVTWAVDASGWELDLTSTSFESMLEQELIQTGAALVRGNSTEILNLDGVLSGIAAAQYSFGSPGIFDFNGAKYNISTGGILPAAPGYGGAANLASINDTGLAFAGGFVPTHLNVHFRQGHETQGLGRSFTLQQQGLTASVVCSQVSGAADKLNLNSSFYPMPVPLADGTVDYWLWAWNITRDCSEGLPSQQQYVTKSDSPIVSQGYSSGLISSIVCPYPYEQTGPSWEHFTVVTNGSWRYGFLPLTVCEIRPLVTISLVNYSNGVINTAVTSSESLESSINLTRFLAALVDYQAWYTQGLTTNDIGDALYAIYVSASDNNPNRTEDVNSLLLRELEQYWRGAIEFSGTFLRSAFSVYPRAIPIDAQIPLSGHQVITTMGWYRRSGNWGYTIVPITIVALMLYVAVAYTMWHIFIERAHKWFPMFDPSNPIHLMMVSSARDRYALKDHLDDWFAGFERGGIRKNERLRVQLTDVSGQSRYRKRFKVTNVGDVCSGFVQTSSP